MKDIKLIRWLVTFIYPMKGKVLLAVLLGIISNIAVVAIPIIGVFEVVALISGESVHLTKSLAIMMGCGLIRGLARYCEQYLNHDIAFRLLAIIREKLFAVIRRLGPAKLIEKKSGDLVTAITTDVEALEVFFAHTVSPVLIALGTTILTVGFLWQYSWILALLLLIGQLLVGLLIPTIGYKKSKDLGDEYQKSFVELNQKVIENTVSLQDIAQYSIEEEQLEQLDLSGRKLNQQYKKRLSQEGTLRSWSECILVTTSVCILLVATQLNLSVLTVMLATVLSLSSFGPVLALSGLGSALLTTLASARRLFTLTNEQPKVEFLMNQKELAEFNNCQLSTVSFGYSLEQKEVLSDVSMTINEGRIIGIGGESGNGKSTLVKLLMRYWDPKTGEIIIDQTNLKEVTETALHSLEGVMEQMTFVFEDTVANNIGLGKKQATQEEIEAAAKKAALHEWILSLPEKYETKIGKHYRNISDGERQRIGLARLFLHDAPFLLLDEPTSNLDYLNEQAILNTLATEIKDKTVLVISHRETTLSIADERYTLENGCLNVN